MIHSILNKVIAKKYLAKIGIEHNYHSPSGRRHPTRRITKVQTTEQKSGRVRRDETRLTKVDCCLPEHFLRTELKFWSRPPDDREKCGENWGREMGPWAAFPFLFISFISFYFILSKVMSKPAGRGLLVLGAPVVIRLITYYDTVSSNDGLVMR